MDFSEQLTNLLGVHAEGLTILDKPDPIEFENLGDAIVILHAVWSGPSHKVVREYAKSYQRLSGLLAVSVKFYVLNFDLLSEGFFSSIPGPFGGNGETYLVKNGIIRRSIPWYTELFQKEVSNCFGAID